MSYDLYALDIPDGEDALETWGRLMEAEEETLESPTPRDATKEQRKEDLTRALVAAFPRLERFDFDYAEIARATGTSEAEAREQYRHIELNMPEDANPIQIVINDDNVAASVPYWHDDDRARSTYEELLAMFRIVQEQTGWTIVDPQLERVLDLESDLDAVLAKHAEGVGIVREYAEAAEREDEGGFLRRLFRR